MSSFTPSSFEIITRMSGEKNEKAKRSGALAKNRAPSEGGVYERERVQQYYKGH